MPPADFFFGLRWEPQIAIRPDQIAGAGAFGAVPVFLGTLVIADHRHAGRHADRALHRDLPRRIRLGPLRAVVKPMLEILAGVPTVVYGFFAVLTVAPAIRQRRRPARPRHLAQLGARRRRWSWAS